MALTDASGNVVVQYEYDAWGNIVNRRAGIGGSPGNPYTLGA
ncbi:hypothetical protein TGS27_2132 [Geobacillus stearothermophilus]|uniref:Wall-associated protein n=1 Tax=Geobacillus stearothermophilus TaxID=1422 RepID=A0A150MBV5_GEOSE|nr:hypothetical protein GS8_3091 [Geobacillus stearothermophilus]KYD22030.1 hypothetical protein B4109_2596 [Geobacillus stearothermophilus]OAO79619.1 hypothetical protein TGS27_2132 [Geobacillus stearothermophilus]